MATLTNSATISLGTPLHERIGNTPLIRLERLTADLPGIQILGKAEWANPGGSVKDRAASAIVADARERGLLTPGSIFSTPPAETPGSPTPCLAQPWVSPSPSVCRKCLP